MKPVIAIVGRANVGKSTLFNRITKSRDAIVADFAGLTRDRHYGNARLGGREFIVVDTGGFEPDKPSGVVAEMAKQTRQAVAEADAVIFVVDVRGGLSAQDHDIARYLRAQQKRVLLAANKAEGMTESPLLGEFFELGIGTPHPISSAHGQGIRSLLEAALEDFPEAEAEPEPADAPVRLAVAGRPNVGKSTLINAWHAWLPSTSPAPLATPSTCPSSATAADSNSSTPPDCAAAGKSSRRSRNSRSSRRCRPWPTPMWWCCCSTPPRA